MDTSEIVTMCKKLASKYRQHHIRDDLVSEGIVAVYERLKVKPEEYPASLYRRANKAMYDYINIKTKAITIPTSDMATQIARGEDWENQTYSDSGKKKLLDALSSTVVGFDDQFMTFVSDCTEMYEFRDYITKAMKLLNEKEKKLINMRYFKDMTQLEVSLFYGITQPAVSLWETETLKKMTKL